MLPLSIFIAGASFALAASSPSTATSSCCGSVPTRQHQQQIMEQYLDLWAGNYSLEHAILSPDVHLYQDRFPTGNRTRVVAPTSSREFVDFVKSSREGWKEYAFGLMNSAFDGYNVVIRWKLNANVGTKFKFPRSVTRFLFSSFSFFPLPALFCLSSPFPCSPCICVSLQFSSALLFFPAPITLTINKKVKNKRKCTLTISNLKLC